MNEGGDCVECGICAYGGFGNLACSVTGEGGRIGDKCCCNFVIAMVKSSKHTIG